MAGFPDAAWPAILSTMSRRAAARGSAAGALGRRATRLVRSYVASVTTAASREKRRGKRTLREALDEFLREFVSEALERNRTGARWNVKGTARDLGIDRGRLQRLIDRLDLKPRKRRPQRHA